jgi:prepilin-type N-terminal cleavage/methylation domain-containing protein
MKTDDKGFTLVEVLVAIVVLSIGIMAMQMMQGRSIDVNSSAGRISEKSMLGAEQIEQILSLPYNHVFLNDTDGDGTNQDIDANGLDAQDDGIPNTSGINEDFGLRHSQCCPGGVDPRGNVVPGCVAVADYCPAPNPGNDFEIYWNVAVDHPVTNTKTINIIVINSTDRKNQVAGQVNQSPNRAEYTFIKDDVI